MSERGSFVTEFIYCDECLAAAKKVLVQDHGGMRSKIISFPDRDIPIIAGEVKGLYSGEELHAFEFELIEKLQASLCHDLRITVLAGQGQEIFLIKKDEVKKLAVNCARAVP